MAKVFKLAVAAVAFFICSNSASAQFGGGNGSSGNPYRISTAVHLKSLADSVNGGQSYSGKYFRLENDIDLSDYGKGAASFNSGKGWIPIGNSSGKFFGGDFNGNGKKITNLYINDGSLNYAGLFGVVYDGSFIYHLGVENVNISGNISVGSIVGWLFLTSTQGHPKTIQVH